MPYMTASDYRTYIQPVYFSQLLQTDDSKRIIAEAEALAIVKGKIEQRYDVSTEFTNTLPWSATTIYNARGRVIIDYPAYSTTSAYAIGVCVIQNSTGYVCTSTIASPGEAFNPGHWSSLGPQYSIYFVSYPPICTYQPTLAEPNNPVFNLYRYYSKGDIVFWKGYTYTCAMATIFIQPCNLIQFYQYKNVPNYNIFPDDGVNNANSQYWMKGAYYSLAADTLPTVTYATYNPATTYSINALVTYNGLAYISTVAFTGAAEAFNPQYWNLVSQQWTLGDNRDQQLTMCMKAIVVYNLSPLLSPRNVVTEWADRYEMAMHTLKNMAEGNISVDIPQIEPRMGMMTSYGGNIKQNNRYILIFLISNLVGLCLM